ncbi:MAG: SMP-30/gluconolactonase/LRE family protein [Microthrixaceae bacterium]
MARPLSTLSDGGRFFEGPRWRDGTWWVSDFYRHGVFTVTPDGTETLVLEVEAQPSGLGWLPDGRLLVVSMKDQRVLRREHDGSVVTHADLSGLVTGPANDMVVDEMGRAWVGAFGFELMAGEDPAPSPLIRVDPDGTISVAAAELMFPNGSVVTPDGSTLIVGETMGCRYTAFTIQPDGTLADRRVWAELAPTPAIGSFEETIGSVTVGPDGCTLDADGQIWLADAIGARCVRVAEGGEITDEIPMPDGLGAFACMLGGPEGTTLLICAAPDFFEHLRSEADEAVLLTAEVDVPHAGRP